MISVLTYEIPHRRSQETLLRLAAKNIEARVIILDWTKRDNFKPLYEHRPGPIFDIDTQTLASNLGFDTLTTKHDNLYSTLEQINPEYTLLAGARLITKEVTDKFKIINAHPAYLPFNRGLDALKWALYDGTPIGVTTHIINEDIDSGLLIKRRFVKLEAQDDFWKFATRIYDLECRMLVDALEDIKNIELLDISKLDPFGNPNKRMAHRLELTMMDRFNKRRIKVND